VCRFYPSPIFLLRNSFCHCLAIRGASSTSPVLSFRHRFNLGFRSSINKRLQLSEREVFQRIGNPTRDTQRSLIVEEQAELARELSTLQKKLERAERQRVSERVPRFDSSSRGDMPPSRLKITIGSKRAKQSVSAESDTIADSRDDTTESELLEDRYSEDSVPLRRSWRVKRHAKKRKFDDHRPADSRMLNLKGGCVRSSSQSSSNESKEFGTSSADDMIPHLRSGNLASKHRRKPKARGVASGVNIRRRSYDKEIAVVRRSTRTTRTTAHMAEIGIDDIERPDSESFIQAIPKAIGAREAFNALPRDNFFRLRHRDQCETCGNKSGISDPLIYCQGCSFAYHRDCIGSRGGRGHLVTKIGDGDFVLQCRRCVNVPRQKDLAKTDRRGIAPRLSRCQACYQDGAACAPFRKSKTMLQEQREREENNGEDPIVPVDPLLINNATNVLFRCVGCSRPFHFHHLPSRTGRMDIEDQTDEERAQQRFSEYSRGELAWRCKDCADAPAKVGAIIAWRPIDLPSCQPGVKAKELDEDEKEYLLKWDGLSYFHAAWKPGSWVWGVTNISMRVAFFNKEDGPTMKTEDAIPDNFLLIDIVLDVHYANVIGSTSGEIDGQSILDVDKALVKYKGLDYEDAVWEMVPNPEDEHRWTCFVTAYNDWVLGWHIRLPMPQSLKSRLERARSQPFEEKTKQPENVVGGELMRYQLEGLNWLYRQWYNRRCGILADEMGLGKTIQIIAFITMLVDDFRCYPFLIVVPNATCPNWRREIKKWAPQIRVVTYYGSAKARQMAQDYEMFPRNSTDLRCHVVITSYEAAIEESCQRVFKKLASRWQGLFIDEGHRLKNDKSLLYSKLQDLKIPFRILLTGSRYSTFVLLVGH